MKPLIGWSNLSRDEKLAGMEEQARLHGWEVIDALEVICDLLDYRESAMGAMTRLRECGCCCPKCRRRMNTMLDMIAEYDEPTEVFDIPQ